MTVVFERFVVNCTLTPVERTRQPGGPVAIVRFQADYGAAKEVES